MAILKDSNALSNVTVVGNFARPAVKVRYCSSLILKIFQPGNWLMTGIQCKRGCGKRVKGPPSHN